MTQWVVEGGLRLASRIASRNPALKVTLVVPQTDEAPAAGCTADVNVTIMPLPKSW